MRVPAALIALPFTAGCAGGLLVQNADPSPALCAAAAAVIGLLSAVALLVDDRADECAVAVGVAALVAGISLGESAASAAYNPPLLSWFLSAPSLVRSSTVLHGRIREDAAQTATGVSLVLDVERAGSESASGGVRLSVAGTLAAASMREWRTGRIVKVAAALRQPAVYWNPGVPDERRMLARRGIALVGSSKSAALVEITARGSALDEWASSFRSWVRTALASSVAPWGARSAAVATAIAIGDRTGLAQEDERRLQEAGTYHVVAISGGNIAILTMILLGIMRALHVPPRGAAAAAILVLLFYGRVTGPAPSVDRAIGVAVIFLSGRLIDLRGPSINVLAIAAVLGLAASPVAVFDPGFILSFGATLAILVGVPRMLAWTRHADPAKSRTARVTGLLVGVLAATAAAEIVLGPVGAALFGRVTFAGLLLNVAAIPLMTVVQAGSLVVLAVFASAPEAALACGYVVHAAAHGLVDSARLVDRAPWLIREVSPPVWGLLATYYAGIVIAISRTRLTIIATVTATVVGLLIVASPHTASRDAVAHAAPGHLRIVFLDVGQGDSTLLILPDRRALLVDAGGLPPAPLQDPEDGPPFDVGERVISRALRAFGVRSLDTFVLTHGDSDHIGGGRSVMKSFGPRAIWEGVPVPPFVPLRILSTLAEQRGIEWRTVLAGDRVKVAGVDIRTLHPPPPEWERQRVRNDDSIAIAVRYGDVSVILPGDVGREGETHMLTQLEPATIVVLKAPHHGSATSSTPELLAATRPRAVVFSAGRDNRFGHPHPLVVSRYRAIGAEIFSTAADGAVILDTDGRSVKMTGWLGRSVELKASR